MTDPHPPVRDVVAEIWTTVLGTPIDDDADFFELGGHSMLATRMISHLGHDLGVRVTLREVLDHSVLSEFVPLVEAKMAELE